MNTSITKQKLLPILILVIGLAACKDENCTPSTKEAHWISGKTIVYDYNEEFGYHHYNSVDGEGLIFVFSRTGAQCADVYDYEWGEQIVFELVDLNTTQFEFTDSEILTTNCYYQQSGAWVNHLQYQVKEGIIKGQLQADKSWKITIDIQTRLDGEPHSNKSIQFTEVFGQK